MSTNFTYFFNSPKGLPLLIDDVNKALGCQLAQCEGDEADSGCKFLSMDLSLGDNEGYQNDDELDYESYKYNIDIKLWSPDNDLLCIALQSITSIAYILFARLDIYQGMLVYDMQTLLAKYEKNKAGNWVDKVSGKMIEFPQHLNEIDRIVWAELNDSTDKN